MKYDRAQEEHRGKIRSFGHLFPAVVSFIGGIIALR